MTLLLRHYYVIITSLLHHYYGNNGAIITVIMGLLLPIITKSIMGNNESIITHYEPTQLADEILNLGRAALAPRTSGAPSPGAEHRRRRASASTPQADGPVLGRRRCIGA